MYYCFFGQCASGSWEENSFVTWVNSTFNGAKMRRGSVLGMLLDLDEGTLAIYRDNRRLGVIKSGLAGEYCWGVCMTGTATTTASIARGRVPID